MGPDITGWVSAIVEDWMGLTISRDKTRTVELDDAGASLGFLGVALGSERDRHGRDKRFRTRVPSATACARERDAIRDIVDVRTRLVPIPIPIGRRNRQMPGWAAHFGNGRSRAAFHAMSWFALQRVAQHRQRRGQRPYGPPNGLSWYAHVDDKPSLVRP